MLVYIIHKGDLKGLVWNFIVVLYMLLMLLPSLRVGVVLLCIFVYMLHSKIENAYWAEKLTTTCCGIRETATMQNCVLWLFLNNCNALWRERKCHNAKCLLKELFIPFICSPCIFTDFIYLTNSCTLYYKHFTYTLKSVN